MLASSTPRSPYEVRGARENTIMIHLKYGSLSGKSTTHMRFDFHVIHQAVPKPMEFSCENKTKPNVRKAILAPTGYVHPEPLIILNYSRRSKLQFWLQRS